ncbi:glycosyltransferase [Psychroflexus planctonicus]|uniref:Glycosyl transferase family 1 n=1 Tax=Psychroflexus planctonicus TaxID=1526575 RepID=A0ABQ1SJL5_9FLAO|nr:glycosyltransferase [Psychroflexus planctonicus]GGE41928.1 glycosyl transferase family 1 [Psychroflexus planctonicus]
MKILLVGEFSGLHNNLKDGLQELGHEVVLASTGDGWKNFPSDFNWSASIFKGKVGHIEHLLKQYKFSKMFKNFDIVQFISSYTIFDNRFGIGKICYKNYIKYNNKSFFVGAGGDPNIWQYWLHENDKLMSNLIDQTNKIDLSSRLVKMLLDPIEAKKTTDLITEANGYIPIMYEYAEPYRCLKNIRKTIPIPINCNKIQYQENKINRKLVVFHGLNRPGAKGTEYVKKAFDILRKKYPNDLELVISGNMKYEDYLKFIKTVNVNVDQTNTYSFGINALNSLASGKVTLGGVEKQSIEELGYDECPALNIKPNAKDIVSKIENLLENKNEIPELGYQSRQFVEKYHNHIQIAKQYLDVWSK